MRWLVTARSTQLLELRFGMGKSFGEIRTHLALLISTGFHFRRSTFYRTCRGVAFFPLNWGVAVLLRAHSALLTIFSAAASGSRVHPACLKTCAGPKQLMALTPLNWCTTCSRWTASGSRHFARSEERRVGKECRSQ